MAVGRPEERLSNAPLELFWKNAKEEVLKR